MIPLRRHSKALRCPLLGDDYVQLILRGYSWQSCLLNASSIFAHGLSEEAKRGLGIIQLHGSHPRAANVLFSGHMSSQCHRNNLGEDCLILGHPDRLTVLSGCCTASLGALLPAHRRDEGAARLKSRATQEFQGALCLFHEVSLFVMVAVILQVPQATMNCRFSRSHALIDLL
jgi:hypothetical protein